MSSPRRPRRRAAPHRLRAAGLKGACAAALAAALSGCALMQGEPECRPATAEERALFGLIVAHDEEALADALAPEAAMLAEELRALEPELADRVFGRRMGDRSVRSVLMQPPLCLYDERVSRDVRRVYVFPSGRFDRLQSPDVRGPELGEPLSDHLACRFVRVEGEDGPDWRLADACLTSFEPDPLAG